MKTFVQITMIMTLVFGAATALAFHDGGVAYCAGCHTMHNSQDGAVWTDGTVTNATGGSKYLLVQPNATDTCLRCHADYGQFADGNGWGAGGDFYWVTKDYTWTFPWGGGGSSTGDSHGHNVLSATYGIEVDGTLATAPGGTFSSALLTCTSCHDPHGQDTFRLLYGKNTDPLGPVGPIYGNSRFTFDAFAPLAVGNSRVTDHTNTHGAEPETDADHTVYKSGMSEWCANCHIAIHEPNTTVLVHPTAFAIDGLEAVYNSYRTTTNVLPFPGDATDSYNALVPFEDVDADLTIPDISLGNTAGPTDADQVMCLSCHRAHASAFPDAARWDMHADLLKDSHPATGDVGLGANDVFNSYYGRDWNTIDPNQRSLCNKCHIKDWGDHSPVAVTP